MYSIRLTLIDTLAAKESQTRKKRNYIQLDLMEDIRWFFVRLLIELCNGLTCSTLMSSNDNIPEFLARIKKLGSATKFLPERCQNWVQLRC